MTKVRTCNGKRRYRSHQEAIQSLHHIKNTSKRDRQPVRAYECPRCHGWHLTSLEEHRG